MARQIPTPPRLGGVDQVEDMRALLNWMYQVYQTLVTEANVIGRVDALSQVQTLTQAISGTPTQAEVQALQAKVNEIITAARTTGA